MNIGELDSRISVFHLEDGTNDLNEDCPVPKLLKTIWAKVQPRTGSLLSGRPAETMLSKTTHVITIRVEELQGITEDCHIVWEDAIKREHRFTIDYILPPERKKQFATIYVQEVI